LPPKGEDPEVDAFLLARKQASEEYDALSEEEKAASDSDKAFATTGDHILDQVVKSYMRDDYNLTREEAIASAEESLKTRQAEMAKKELADYQLSQGYDTQETLKKTVEAFEYRNSLAPGDPGYAEANQVWLQWAQESDQKVNEQKKLEGLKAQMDKNFMDPEWWTWDKAKNVLTGLAAGAYIGDLWGWWGDDEEPPTYDMDEQISKAARAITNKETRRTVMEAEMQDTPGYSDINQRTKYEEQFGPLGDAAFGNEEFGSTFLDRYTADKSTWGADGTPGTADDMDRGDWLLDNYRKGEPGDEANAWLGRELSAVGQIDRAGEEFSELERKSLVNSLDEAAKFYLPEDAGGYGYDPNDFRTYEQQEAVDYARNAATGPVMNALEGSVLDELNKGRTLTDSEYHRVGQGALKRMAPGMQRQMNASQGGAARSIDEVLGRSDARLAQRQQAAGQFAQIQQSYAPALSNIINANTMDPLKAIGVDAGTGRQAYSTSGQGQSAAMYDPTSAYAAAGGAQEYRTAVEAWSNQQSTTDKIIDTAKIYAQAT
tara:strand:- start:11228 stop:12862 length:1635 start_codon:yes stop_codon:yes gene_type:complete